MIYGEKDWMEAERLCDLSLPIRAEEIRKAVALDRAEREANFPSLPQNAARSRENPPRSHLVTRHDSHNDASPEVVRAESHTRSARSPKAP